MSQNKEQTLTYANFFFELIKISIMNKYTLLTITFLFAIITLNAKIIFVQQGTTGNGTSWADATGDLQAALFIAKPGDQIWVTKGIYFPTPDTDRTITFTIPNNVTVLGGFTGSETDANQRDSKNNTTILSGDIGVSGNFDDNSFSVVSFIHTDVTTVLDGFIIQDGTANVAGETGNPSRCGGGIFTLNSNPTILNCTLKNNYGRDGGAVYNNGIGGKSNPTFVNCNFLSNRADLDGGAIFNDGRRGGQSNPTFKNCVFSGNEGNYGGALCNYGGKGESNPTLVNCTFQNNEAYLRGGGIFNMDVEGVAEPNMTHCQFVDNKAVAGEGMYTFSSPDKNMAGVLTGYKSN